MNLILKELFQKFISYCNKEVIKNAFFKALEAFKETLWKSIKEEVKAIAKEAVGEVECFLASDEAKEKEEILLNVIMEKISLPVILKPFKKVIKNIIKSKLENFLQEALDKGKEIIA